MKPVILYSRMWSAGTGLYAQGLARGLALAGYPTIFIAPRGAPDDVAGMANIRRVMPPRELGGTSVSRLRRGWGSLRRIAGGLGAVLAARLRSPRMIVTIPDPLPLWLPVLALLRLSGARVVFVCHDPEPHAWRLGPRWRSAERGAIALQYRLAWRVVALAEASRKALVDKFGIAPGKIAVIPHGAFDAPYAGPLPGRGKLLVFGTIRRNKQVHVALQGAAEAIGRGADISVTVAGGADANDPAYIKEVRAAAAALGERADLRIGYVAEADLDELLQTHDALLLPYVDFESQSGVAVLAGMAGRPVICAAAGGIPDLVASGLAAVTIAAPVGTKEVANAIMRYLQAPPADWNHRAKAGRQTLSVALDWTHVGRLFARMFE